MQSSQVLAAEAPRCDAPVGRIVSLQGEVELGASAAERRPATLEMPVCPDEAIHVGPLSRAAVQLFETETVLRLDQNTVSRFAKPAAPERTFLELLRGAVQFLSRVPRALEIRTPYVNAGIEGTEFLVAVDTDRRQSRIVVYEGVVTAENAHGKVRLGPLQAAVAGADSAPTLETVVRSRDAVAWTLYYQPVLVALAAPGAERPGAPLSAGELRAALTAGGVTAALARLDGLPASARNETTETWRAALLMQVGRWQEARNVLEGLLRSATVSGEARALLSVIYVTRNDTVRALAEAEKAVGLSPRSAAAYLALSYAQQARFDLKAARRSLLKAVEVAPEDALAWARLSELWLSFGDRGRALEAAERAVALAPDLARAHTVLGFAALTRIDLETAVAEFERAIRLASADPLPRLGLGLARIRDGALAEGRREIEVAAALASNSALLRSYLGKAYFEEKRGPLDARQLEMAKRLDPNDPTAFFYDAIRLQTENRPVEALREIERAIALNDNRAVYRSRLLLDEDRAMRGTSLGRIYQDLGFERLAVIEGTRSLGHDPANYSAHRFLADSYALRERHEIARVSELLQAQLLQPLNNEPVQPRLSQTKLLIPPGTGPAEASFNEFTSLFERDDLRFTGSGLVGNNDTVADEATVSGIEGRFSYSLGQFHYQGDGFRANNDQQHDLLNAFAQVALTDQLNAQVELRRRQSEEGDLRLNFDPSNFSTTDRRSVDRDTARVGLHYAPRPGLDFIGSLIYSEHEEKLHIVTTGPTIDRKLTPEGYDAQLQGLYRGEWWNLTAGGGLYDLSDDSSRISDFSFLLIPVPPPIGPICPLPFPGCVNVEKVRIDTRQRNLYAYLNINRPETVTWTLGLSYDSFDNDVLNTDRVNPKFGVQWDVTDWLRLRAAAFRTFKRQLIVDQTVEPTAVAGFNQFFDDPGGTRIDAYSGAVDVRLRQGLYAGLEVGRRDLVVPIFDFFTGSLRTEDQDEERASAYLYWTPGSDWAARAAVEWERFARAATGGGLPERIRSFSVPLAVRYFNQDGLFAELGATFMHQEVDGVATASFTRNEEDFVVVDFALGYRLPRRLGVLSLEARNIFNQSFLYQDSNIRSSEPSTSRFIPERTIFARFTLAF